MDKATLNTTILIGILISVFAIGVAFPTTNHFLFSHFTFLGNAVLDGQVWRLISGSLLHASVLHTAFNCFFLMQIFPWVARSFGLVRTHIVLWSSVIGGAVAAGIGDPTQPSVGISGGLFGLFGVYILSLWTLKKQNGSPHIKSALNTALFMLGLNFYLGFTIASISNLGHIGGLITGLVIGKIYLEHNSLIRSGIS